jgi:competence protein ComEC
MRLPLVLLTYAGGLGCAPFLDPSLLFTGAAVASACLWFPLRAGRAGAICLAIFFFALGVVFYFQETAPPAGPAEILTFVADEPLIVQGEVLTVSRRPEERSEIVVESNRIFVDGKSAKVRGRVLLRIEHGEIAAKAGDEIRFRSRLRSPRIFSTPGEFDYPRHLAAQEIFVTAFLDEGRDLVVFPAAKQTFRFAALQNAAGHAIDAAVNPELSPLVQSLITGDQGGITPEQRDLLARSGLSHLFSISGLHLGLIALFLYLLARFLYCRSEALLLWTPPRRALPFLLLPALWFYLQLTGDALPTRRAFLMALAGVVLLVLCRRTSALRILAAAALLILLFSPLALFEPSFQLSFAGVLGILLVVPHWQARLANLSCCWRWPATLALTTLAASLATTPLVLLHFHNIAPAGLIANMAAVPAIGFLAVPLGLLGMLAIPWWPQGSALFLQGCARVIEAVLILAKAITAWEPLAGWQLYLTPLATLAVFIMAAGLLLVAGSSRSRRGGAGLMMAGCLLLLLPAPLQHGITVTSLSVGQGESTLVSLPPDRHYLIDGGGLSASSYDIGERLLAPALGRLGVRRLEAVILTHDHPDHRLGLLHVLKRLPVGSFWTAEDGKVDPELTAILEQRGIPVRAFAPGWTHVDGELAVFVPAQGADPGNDASLVIRAACGEDAVLLTGDLEAKGVAELLQATPSVAANLLKLPHHGSRRSNPVALIERFRPETAFVSVGAGNSFRFPHAEVVAMLEEKRIPLYRTDQHGTLRFHSDGAGWQVRHWRKGLFRRLDMSETEGKDGQAED